MYKQLTKMSLDPNFVSTNNYMGCSTCVIARGIIIILVALTNFYFTQFHYIIDKHEGGYIIANFI